MAFRLRDEVAEQTKRHPGVDLALVLGEHVEQHAAPAGARREDEVHALLVEGVVADGDAALQAQGGPGDLLGERRR